MTRSTPPNCLLSNALHSFSNTENRLATEVVYALQASIIFVLLKQEKDKSSRSSCHFVPKIKTSCVYMTKIAKRAELWVRSNLFNVFVICALDSAHEKLQRMKRSRYFIVVFDKPGWIERASRPKYKFAEPNWFKRRTLHVPIESNY